MELFDIFRWILIVVLSVNLLPTSIPMAALAYKTQRGARPIDMEMTPFWMRSVGVALGLALLTVAVGIVDFYIVESLDFPAGFVHATFLLVYVPAGIWFVYWMFALDEFVEGVTVFLMYTGIPAIILALLLLFNFRLPVSLAEAWLLPTDF